MSDPTNYEEQHGPFSGDESCEPDSRLSEMSSAFLKADAKLVAMVEPLRIALAEIISLNRQVCDCLGIAQTVNIEAVRLEELIASIGHDVRELRKIDRAGAYAAEQRWREHLAACAGEQTEAAFSKSPYFVRHRGHGYEWNTSDIQLDACKLADELVLTRGEARNV